jgi:hypothetical protein
MRHFGVIGLIIVIAASVVGLRGWSGSRELDQTPAGAPGEIIGQVVDAQGRPVWSAKVHLGTETGQAFGRVIYYPTDGNGNFSIKGLAPGEYNLFVIKEEDRHPDRDNLFYSDKQVPVPKVIVSKTEPTPFVTIQAGPRAALISGRVVNAINGQPISAGVLVTFNRPENRLMTLITSLNQPERPGGFSFLLPSAPVTMRVEAPGYETWIYRKNGATRQADLLSAAPGETIQMDVKMKPLKK